MARALRVEFEGAWYHVLARGNRREAIFLEDSDRELMLETLGEVCGRTGWEVHAWVLMGNHYHFIIRTPQANLVAGMKWFMNSYTRRFNVRHGKWGRLFGDRYKALLIEGPEHAGEEDYLRSAIAYVHLNPVRAGLEGRDENGAWEWGRHSWNSLLHVYGRTPGKRAKWSRAGIGLSLERCDDTKAGRQEYFSEMARRAAEWKEEQRELATIGEEPIRLSRGWLCGGEQFCEEILDQLSQKLSSSDRRFKSSEQGRDHSEHQAMELIEMARECFGWKGTDWKDQMGKQPARVLLAAEISRQTSVGQDWIAKQLGMKSAANVSQQVRRNREKAESKIPGALLKKWRTLCVGRSTRTKENF